MMGRTDERGAGLSWLLAAAATLGAYAAVVAWTGGFTVRIAGVPLRSHSWIRPALLASAAAAVLIAAARDRISPVLVRVWDSIESRGATIALVVLAAVWTAAAAVGFGTFASGGADSYGYVGQARLLARGRLTDTIVVSPQFTWPDVESTLTPLGFGRGRAPGILAPTYPPGFPLLLAPLALVSERAIYMLVPAMGLLALWATYRLGVVLGDPLAGAVSAALLSVSPAFLYQLMQPMSDVPAAACWLCALVAAARRTRWSMPAAGGLASLAIMIRPNLAPLAAVVLIPAAFENRTARARRVLQFTAALLPGLIALAWIQQVRYGSPFASGYGTIADGFSPANIRPNLARYPRWLTESQTWFIWLWLAAPWWIVRRATRPAVAWAAAVLCLAVWTAYLPYVYFQPREWFYIRFLLPALPLMLLFATAVLLSGVRRLPAPIRIPVAVPLVVALLLTLAQSARARGAFEIHAQERKYPLAGAFVRERLPENAFVLAAQHSGSIRYYAHAPTLRWDLLAPGSLDDALDELRAAGRQPFLVVDAGEDEEFRRRFEAAGQRAAHRRALLGVAGDARIYAFDE